MPDPNASRVAYFSMEIALDPAIPTYAGGLGILSGDTLRSAADLGLAAVGVTLAQRKGYFKQELDPSGHQREVPAQWVPESMLKNTNASVSLTIQGRHVRVGAWVCEVRGISGHVVPIYLLDTAGTENSPWDRTLTDSLYGGDERYRLAQEAVLGIGGAALLRELGLGPDLVYHMNEGHSALLALALLEERTGRSRPTDEAMAAVQKRCVFTTHTPVSAGHDMFPWGMVREILGPERAEVLQGVQCCVDEGLDMTHLAMRCSRFVNAVSLRHGETARGLYPRHRIHSITNGIHAATWASPPFQKLFDRHLPGWRRDNAALREAAGIPLHEIREAHFEAKQALFDEIAHRTGQALNEAALTLGFARRATAYKRPTLLLTDIARLSSLARQVGPLQVVYAGKAHPRDGGGKELIRTIHDAARSLGEAVRIVYLEDYEMSLAQKLTAGVDVWLNNPTRPLEASGTSGMKAALNGVPSLSVLDGWWVEGHVEGASGWSIGNGSEPQNDSSIEAVRLYEKLERVILPLYYRHSAEFAQVMRSAIALNGSFFNTHRMVEQYLVHAYFPQNDSPAEGARA